MGAYIHTYYVRQFLPVKSFPILLLKYEMLSVKTIKLDISVYKSNTRQKLWKGAFQIFGHVGLFQFRINLVLIT